MRESGMLLGTHWELVEHVENLMRTHREFVEHVVNLMRTHWEQKKSISPPKPSPKEKIWAPWVHVASTHCMPGISIPTSVC
jgi:hypothetical protein